MMNKYTNLCGYHISSCLTFFSKVNETQTTLWNQDFCEKNVYRKIIIVELIFKGLYLWKCFLSQTLNQGEMH